MLIKNLFKIKYQVAKKILKKQQSHQIIYETACLMSKVAAITLGPKGRNVLIQSNHPTSPPRITKDGVTVVKHLQFENRLSDTVATLIKKSVDATNKYAGDGTTSSTILISQIYKKAIKKYGIGASKRSLRLGLQKGRDICLQYIDSVSRPVQTFDDLMKVAMISTNKNQKISKIVSQAVYNANLITIQKSQKAQSYIQYYSGMKFTRGIPNELLINKGDKIVYNYPFVVVSMEPIKQIKQIIKVLQLAKKARKQLVIFAEDISDSVMSTLIYNHQKKIIQVCGIKVPAYGDKASGYLKQICQRTGAYQYNKYSLQKIENIDFNKIGKAIKVQIDQFQTFLMGTNSQKDQNAIIFVGGNTQQVALQLYDKMIDALNSVKQAKKHGVVAGGGMTLWKMGQLLQGYHGQDQQGVRVLGQALKQIRKDLFKQSSNPQRVSVMQGWKGYDIVDRKQRQKISQIMYKIQQQQRNKDQKIDDRYQHQKIEKNNKNSQQQALSSKQQMIDMFQAGIIDSVSVCKSTIIDSVSLASMLIDIDVSIIRANDNIADGIDFTGKYQL